ncbi:MAG TPA: glucosamine-6-phosphate deaminase [Vicinamibacterales bacterium]|nr:glucosamine-6-phosphate deaminase [Vicinamibacterales bacterium]
MRRYAGAPWDGAAAAFGFETGDESARHKVTEPVPMLIKTYVDRSTMSRAAARHASRTMRDAAARSGRVRLVAATGASQFEFLAALTDADIDWSRVQMFHLDEYVGLSIDHPASFRKYLLERLITPTGLGTYHLLDGEHDPEGEADRIGRELAAAPVDVAFVGIGENGHLAFNDPPADFAVDRPYLVVTLDEACRRQQVGEGWFTSIGDVPARAISMSVRQILKSREIICVVPDARKAGAVRACVEGEVSPLAPASILRTHANTTLYLDQESAALLSPASRGRILESDES